MRRKITMLFVALLACVGVMAQWSGKTLQSVSITPATTLESGYYVIYNNGRGTFMNSEAALGEAKVTWPVTASAVGLAAFNNGEALTNNGEKNRNAYVFYLTLEEDNKLSLMTGYGDYIPALTVNGKFNYTAEKGLWDYKLKVEGENSYLFMWNDGVGLDCNGWGADAHEYSTVAGWNVDGSQNVSGNQSWTLHKAVMVSASEEYKALTSLIATAEALAKTVNENVGTAIGEYPETTANALNSALATAKAIGENEVEQSHIDALQAAIDAVSYILPTVGKYYQFHSSFAAFSETKAVYSDGSAPAWKTLNEGDLSFYWEAVDVDGGVVFKNVADGKYMAGAAGQSQAWTMSETPTAASKVNVKIFNKAANVRGYEYGVILNNWQMHCNGHGEGAGTASNIVSWNTDQANSASAWYIVEASNPAEDIKANIAALKKNAEDIKSELEEALATAPINGAVAALDDAIAEATAVAGSTDLDALNAATQTLNAALAMAQNLTFEGGALASLENGEYVVYYVDANGKRRYLASQKSTKRAVISDSPMVYDVTIGNTGGYVSYAYYFNMNGSRLSNPTNDDYKFIQVEPEGSNNYNGNRVWDSQVLYVNGEGKYAIRSTNCEAGSGWNSDCFIKVSEDGVTVTGQNTELSDALYMWNVVKASEADIAFELTVDEYKYMTLFVNYAVTVPDGAMAYAVSEVEDGELALTEVGAVIPENTPVIIETEAAGDYAFTYAAPEDAYEGANMLKGSWFDSYITPTAGYDAYVMALNQKKGEVVMGKAKLTEEGGRFICRANKAYLEIAQDVAAGAAMFSFGRGEGTTAIHNAQFTIDNVVIYDLTGRRVEKMEKGIYIVNGKKVIR